MTAAQKRWTLVATILASAMTFIDGTVVNVALPALQAALRATITDVQWVVEAYALFLGALILVGGSLGDQLGRKRVFLFGTVFFTAASVMCGVATSPRVLILGRALQGIGAPTKSRPRRKRCLSSVRMASRGCSRVIRIRRGRGCASSRPTQRSRMEHRSPSSTPRFLNSRQEERSDEGASARVFPGRPDQSIVSRS